MRQPPDSEPAVRAYAVTHPGGTVIPPQGPHWDQLVHASRGVITVQTLQGTWTVPPHRAVWVPAGVDHHIEMAGRVAMRTLYFRAGLAKLPSACRAVNVPPLLRELILHAAALCPLDDANDEHLRLAQLILDQLSTLPTAPLQLPLPRDPRAMSIARALIDDPASADSVDLLARRGGASGRTLERLFLTETGMTLDQWRRRLRLVAALRLLAAGQPVTSVALAVGYNTPSAFTAMFRREMGAPPGRYFQR